MKITKFFRPQKLPAKIKKINSDEYVFWCLKLDCCQKECLKSWSFKEIRTHLANNVSIQDKAKSELQ